MTRKDTIIIAVLVNLAVLIVLFVSAIKTEKQQPVVASSTKQFNQNLDHSKKFSAAPIKSAEGDEIDLVLKQYAPHSSPTTPNAASIPMASSTHEMQRVGEQPFVQKVELQKEEKVAEKKFDFAEDLKAISFSSPRPSFSEKPAALQENATTTFVEVTVKKGDALEKIARAHQCSVEEIMSLNHLKSTQLKIGQVLKVQPGKGKKASPAEKAIQEVATPQYYVVKNGDNPWTIAVKNHLKVEELLKLNDLNQDSARRLKPGDKLRIR